MKKKYIISGAILVLLVAGGFFFFVNKKEAKAPASNTSEQKVEPIADKVDESLNACTLLDKAAIKTALGSAADALAGPNDAGTFSLKSNGDKSQLCTYPFVEGAPSSNSFYVDIASYSSQAGFDDASKVSGVGGASVSGVGDSASYLADSDAAIGAKKFVLTVKKDKKIYLFGINQPTAAVTFTDASARTALEAIARAVKL